MKKQLLNLVLLLFCGVIWMFPFRYNAAEWAGVCAFVLSFACMYFIPQKTIGISVAAAVSVGFGIYAGEYFAVFAPGVAVCAVFFAAAQGRSRGLPVKRDLLFLLTAAAAVLCAAVGLWDLSGKNAPADLFREPVELQVLYAFAAAVFFAVLAVFVLRKPRGRSRGGALPPENAKTAFALFAMAAVCAVGLANVCTSTVWPAWCLMPALLCTFAVLTVPNCAMDAFLRKNKR